jgi:hypothetical protein
MPEKRPTRPPVALGPKGLVRWRYYAVSLILLLLVWTWRIWNLPFEGYGVRNTANKNKNLVEADYVSDWDDIEPNEELHWVPCFGFAGNFLCAKLTVPLDYTRPLSLSKSHPEAHIALVLLPGAGHGVGTGRFSASPLLLNPGGPGGSGTEFVLQAGPILQDVVGSQYDILGFDPRGVGATMPKADCFVVDDGTNRAPGYRDRNAALLNRYTWQLMAHDIGLPNSSHVALQKIDMRAKALTKLCAIKDVHERNGFRYMGTPNVATDMRSIITAWDKWLTTDKFKVEETSSISVKAGEPMPSSTRGKLVYWGFSYGTLLGATFAAMFRKQRQLLDNLPFP